MAARDPRTGHLVPGRGNIVTSGVSLARQAWRYGEAPLAHQLLGLPPADVLDICIRATELMDSGTTAQIWPAGPSSSARSALVLASIEFYEGAPRAPVRSRRLPEKSLPPELQCTEAERWAAIVPVNAELGRRTQRASPP